MGILTQELGDTMAAAFDSAFPLKTAELWRDNNLAGTAVSKSGQVIADWQQVGELSGRVQSPPTANTVVQQAAQETAVAEAVFLTRYGFGVSQYQQARPGDRIRVYLDFERTKADEYSVLGIAPQEGLALDTTLRLVRVKDGQGLLPESAA